MKIIKRKYPFQEGVTEILSLLDENTESVRNFYRAMGKVQEIKLKDLDKIDFNSPKLKAEADEIERKNKELLKSTKPDWRTMHRTFDV